MNDGNAKARVTAPSPGRRCLSAACAIAIGLGTTLPHAAILAEGSGAAYADEPAAAVQAADAENPASAGGATVPGDEPAAESTAGDPDEAGEATRTETPEPEPEQKEASDHAVTEPSAAAADDTASTEAAPPQTEEEPSALVTQASDEQAVGQTFAVDSVTYSITALAADDAPGSVQITRTDSSLSGDLVVPARVTAPESGREYAVTGIQFAAFANRSALTSITLPASIETYRYYYCNNLADAGFVGCTSLRSITVEDGCPCLKSIDGVLYASDDQGRAIALVSYPQAKTDAHLDVPGTVHTVAGFAFRGNPHIESVAFAAGLAGDPALFAGAGMVESTYLGGIGASAFEGCTALESVTFPDDAVIATCTSSVLSAIGNRAFAGCTALERITVPAIATAERKAGAYASFDELNPGSNLFIGTSELFASGYSPYWHNANGPVARPGIGEEAFEGCTALTSVTFAAGGNLNGAFSYWTGSTTVFDGCDALEALVFEDAQPYWGNPNASMRNGAFANIWKSWGDDEDDAPTYYYAVDYYATAEDAIDGDADERLARVEYARGTSTAAIATSERDLDEAMPDRELYALTDEDGIAPDPAEAAARAGLGPGTWVWKLTGTQSKRAGLEESCTAYLAKLDDLSTGRVDMPQVAALYRQADRNLSQGTVADTAFDPARFAAESTYVIEPLAGEATPWVTYNASTGKLGDGLIVRAADGTLLDEGSYTVSFQRYDAGSGTLVAAEPGEQEGAFLVTVTPAAQSGYTGILQEWLLIKKHSGTFAERFGTTASDAADAARHPYSQVTALDYGDAPFSVTVGAGDAVGALVATGYAGLAEGAVNVDASGGDGFGMALNPSTYPTGEVKDAGQSISYPRANAKTGEVTPASNYANAVYLAVENRRARLGIPASMYPWGDQAVLVPAAHVDDLASIGAYAYAMKAPVFFTEDDGSVSAATLACLKRFGAVAVAGNADQFSDADYKSLKAALGADAKLQRIGSDAQGAGPFSACVADLLVQAGKASYEDVAICDGSDPVTCVAALNYTGHVGGVTLVAKSTDEAIALAQALHANNMNVNAVALYGPADAENAVKLESSAYDGNVFAAIWEDDATFAEAIAHVTSAVDEYASARAETGGQNSAGEGREQVGPSPEAGEGQPGTEGAGDNGGADVPPASESESVVVEATEVIENVLSLVNDYTSLPTASGSLAVLNPVQTIVGAAASTASAAEAAQQATASDADALLAEDGLPTDLPSAIDAAQRNAAEQAGLESGENAPLTKRLPFLASLAALCTVSIPMLRKIK